MTQVVPARRDVKLYSLSLVLCAKSRLQKRIHGVPIPLESWKKAQNFYLQGGQEGGRGTSSQSGRRMSGGGRGTNDGGRSHTQRITRETTITTCQWWQSVEHAGRTAGEEPWKSGRMSLLRTRQSVSPQGKWSASLYPPENTHTYPPKDSDDGKVSGGLAQNNGSPPPFGLWLQGKIKVREKVAYF